MPPKKAAKSPTKSPAKSLGGKAKSSSAKYAKTSRRDDKGRVVYTRAGKDYTRHKKADGTFGMRAATGGLKGGGFGHYDDFGNYSANIEHDLPGNDLHGQQNGVITQDPDELHVFENGNQDVAELRISRILLDLGDEIGNLSAGDQEQVSESYTKFSEDIGQIIERLNKERYWLARNAFLDFRGKNPGKGAKNAVLVQKKNELRVLWNRFTNRHGYEIVIPGTYLDNNLVGIRPYYWTPDEHYIMKQKVA